MDVSSVHTASIQSASICSRPNGGREEERQGQLAEMVDHLAAPPPPPPDRSVPKEQWPYLAGSGNDGAAQLFTSPHASTIESITANTKEEHARKSQVLVMYPRPE